MLGRKLLLELQWIAVHAFVGSAHSGVGWMSAGEAFSEQTTDEEDALWFDFLADTGDSTYATYRVARACLADLHLDGTTLKEAGAGELLPRGSFLVLGGDAAYHVADGATLRERLLKPFGWALEDSPRAARDEARPVYAIPGNHDHYDALVGFNRLFRPPVAEQSVSHKHVDDGPLELPGFVGRQGASYFAIELPNDWLLLGLDAQDGEMDSKQVAYFKDLLAKKPRKKLVICTPNPTTVLGERAKRPPASGKKPRGDVAVRVLRAIGLDEECATPFLSKDANVSMRPGHCRLDLSGDTHHYARYWGGAKDGGIGTKAKPSSASYASVVCGLGGAFMHPPHARTGEIEPNEQYPDDDRSRQVTYERLLDPVRMVRSGNVGLVGFLVGSILWVALNDARPQFYRASVAGLAGAASLHVWLAAVVSALALGVLIVLRLPPHRSASRAAWTLGVAAVPCITPWAAHVPEGTRLGPGVWAAFVLGMSALAVVYFAVSAAQRLAERATRELTNAVGAVLVVAAFVAAARSTVVFGDASVASVAIHAGMLFVGLLAVLLTIGAAAMNKKWGFLVLGLAMATLQIGLPAIWSVRGDWRLMLGAPFVIAGVGFVAKALKLWSSRALFIALGAVSGAIALAAPFIGSGPRLPAPLHLFLVSAYAGVTSCMWLGWYFAIALSHGKHVNEAGSAVGVDEVSAMLRIRLDAKGIEVFAISTEGDAQSGRVDFRLIDRFRLVPADAQQGRK